MLTQAIRDGLRRRGADHIDALLVSQTVVRLFDTALELWTAEDADATLASLITDSYARVAQLVAPPE